MGYEVEVINVYPSHDPKKTTPKVDVQLFIEKLQQPWLKWGQYNMFVINQEIEHNTSLYNQLNAIICKSKWAQLLVEDYIASPGKKTDLSNIKVWYTGGPISPLLSLCRSSENKTTRVRSLPSLQATLQRTHGAQ